MAIEPVQAGGEVLYPSLEPYRHGLLEVGGGHQIYFEECGNPKGFPVVFVHGGPGSQSRPVHRRFFDPEFYRIVLFDQRGCGQSRPKGLLAENTTAHLIADVEFLRIHLKIDRWLLFGGSWGSTLTLAYTIAHPAHVAGMVLRGVFLGSRPEVDWFLYGVRYFVPEAWSEFARDSNGSLLEHYQRRVHDPRPEHAMAAAKSWSDYETRVMEPASILASSSPASLSDNLEAVRVQLHFLLNDLFLRHDELRANLWRIQNTPVTIVQGRMDMVCPPITAIAVAHAISGSDLRLVATGGHSAVQRDMAAELCAATRNMKTLLR